MLRQIHEWIEWLLRRQARRVMHGTATLRHAYEHVAVMAAIEGVRPGHRPYYEGYVDALHILGAKAASIARNV